MPTRPLFVRYREGDTSGWIYFERPTFLDRSQYMQVPLDRVTFLSQEGMWFGGFYYETDGGGTRHLRRVLVFFGTGAQVWARARHQLGAYAPRYHIRPLKCVADEHTILLEACASCRGKGEIKSWCPFEERDLIDPCEVCQGTAVQEKVEPRV